MVAVVTVAVVVILVAKVLVWAEAVINMLVEELVIDVRVGVEIIVLALVAIALDAFCTRLFSITTAHEL